jgi:hypothetical protein
VHAPTRAELNRRRRNPLTAKEAARELSREDFLEHLKEIKGLPVQFKHWDNLDDGESPRLGFVRNSIGRVTEAELDAEGTAWVVMRPFADVWGEWMVEQVFTNQCYALSLQHHVGKDGKLTFVEVSICQEGYRRGTGITSVQIFEEELPPLPGGAAY